MKNIYPTIYKIDTRGKVREWHMEQDGSRYRTISGLKDGKQAETGWTQAETTNAGRANERDPVAQATFEIEAEYEYNLKRTYHHTIEGAQGGAHFFEPMLAETYKKGKGTDFQPGFAQPKLDGIRCVTKADGLWSREGEPILGAPHIFKVWKPLLEIQPSLIIDGELYNHDLKDDFNSISSFVRKQKPTPEMLEASAKIMQYHVYDLPSSDRIFSERTKALLVLVERVDSDFVRDVPTAYVEQPEEYDELHGLWLEAGYEGSVLRRDSLYENRRTKALLKRKEFIDAEFECVRIEEGKGNWAGAAKRVICRMPDGREFGAGIKGSYKRGVELLTEMHKVVTIKYFSLTPDGIPRFGVATKFHGEKRTL